MPEAGGGFDVVLADLGVSSMQIDNPARGFTFKAEGPLDLRLDPSSGQSASALLQSVTRRRLRELLLDNADEPYAEPLAAALQGQYLETTTELAALVRQTLQTALARGMPEADRRAETRKALQRSFQALRIAVNDEFGVLDALPGGTAVLPEARWSGGDPQLSLGRGPARQEGLPGGRACRHLRSRGARSGAAVGRRAARQPEGQFGQAAGGR